MRRAAAVSLVWFVSGLACIAAFAEEKPPLASGQYRILLGGERIGEEQFRVAKDKGYRIEATKTLYWPEPSREELSLQLDATLAPERALIDLTRAGLSTSLQVRAQGKNWRSETKGRGLKTVKQELGRREDSEIHLGSPLFHWTILKRLTLAPESHRALDVVTLAPPSLAGRRESITYRRLADEEVSSEALGKVLAAVYEVATPNSQERLWVAPSGFPLRSERQTPSGRMEVVLVRFQTKPGAF
jgi:hypothetical protein